MKGGIYGGDIGVGGVGRWFDGVNICMPGYSATRRVSGLHLEVEEYARQLKVDGE